jgi:hypothetical protein
MLGEMFEKVGRKFQKSSIPKFHLLAIHWSVPLIRLEIKPVCTEIFNRKTFFCFIFSWYSACKMPHMVGFKCQEMAARFFSMIMP